MSYPFPLCSSTPLPSLSLSCEVLGHRACASDYHISTRTPRQCYVMLGCCVSVCVSVCGLCVWLCKQRGRCGGGWLMNCDARCKCPSNDNVRPQEEPQCNTPKISTIYNWQLSDVCKTHRERERGGLRQTGGGGRGTCYRAMQAVARISQATF